MQFGNPPPPFHGFTLLPFRAFRACVGRAYRHQVHELRDLDCVILVFLPKSGLRHLDFGAPFSLFPSLVLVA
jgi:hypothetical protein